MAPMSRGESPIEFTIVAAVLVSPSFSTRMLPIIRVKQKLCRASQPSIPFRPCLKRMNVIGLTRKTYTPTSRIAKTSTIFATIQLDRDDCSVEYVFTTNDSIQILAEKVRILLE